MAPRPRPDCDCNGKHLSRREVDILRLVASGFSYKEIARALHISPRTVEQHLQSARCRAGARNVPELIARGFAAGILLVDTWPIQTSGRSCLLVRRVA